MIIQKPKKALRGLFSRTEPEQTIEENLNINKNINESLQDVHQSLVLPNEDSISQAPSDTDELKYKITTIQYNFDRLRKERNNWDKNEYISFLNRIDNAQTEAFFLKGRLINEIKIKFYEGNKIGWKNFCDEKLNMNYTTANQYIRVAEEFTTLIQQRNDFGFEHFKALLPVPITERVKILENVPKSISVKSLRNIISKTLNKENNQKYLNNNKNNIRLVTDNLEKIKVQLNNLNLNSLEQSEKWSLLGAFKNLTDEMSKLSEKLSKPIEARYSAKQMGATSAQIEDDYAT